MKTTPFGSSRFEFEGRHIYYLPKGAFAELEEPKPAFLIGSRGTGKTTLLKALNWEERLDNESLKRQLEKDPFAQRYIGVYFKAPEYQLAEIHAWLENESNDVYGTVTGFFFDLLSISLLADAIARLTARGILRIPPECEHTAVREIIEKCEDSIRNFLPRNGPYTLLDFAKACTKTAIEWQRFAQLRVSLATVLSRIPPGNAGGFSRACAPKLGALCDLTGGRWHFKVCIDESETIPARQQITLNTLVRLAVWPLFPVISYVRHPEDFTRTFLKDLTLQEADRNLKTLDDMTDPDFQELAEGVVAVRAAYALKKKVVNVSLERLLGKLDVNKLLEPIVRDSVKKEAKTLLARAKQLKNTALFAETPITESSDALPLYQAYLIEKLALAIPSSTQEQWERRAQESAEIRKRMVAAYLSICADLNAEIRYASADMVLQLSDKCTRDFLAQMEKLYLAVEKPPATFLAMSISYNDQIKPLKEASQKKRKSLIKFGVKTPTDTARLVDGLARVTAIVQTTSRDLQHLRTSERGIFTLDLEEANHLDASSLVRLVLDASEAGFLRVFPADGKSMRFRVHTSLAAAYGFSYRGAYYPIRLSWRDIDRWVRAGSEDEHGKVTTEIGNRLAGQEDDDLPLFTGRLKEAGA